MKNIQLSLTQHRRFMHRLLTGSTALAIVVSASVYGNPTPIPAALAFTPGAPTVNAAAYILVDYNSGKVLSEMNADTRRDPASLTKIMTSYVIGKEIQAGKVSQNDIVTIGREAWATGNPVFRGSSLMFLKPGDKVSVADLNRGIVIQSGNDASVAMAEHIAGSQNTFVALMNGYADTLGLTNTRFETVHGLDAPGQYTSARDMASLSRALIKEAPTEYALYKEKEFIFNKIRQPNRNGLLWDTTLSVDGIKTGHTDSAGYNLVASATQGNMRLISVVLGANSAKGREEDSKKLLTWGFRFFETIPMLKANSQFTAERVWYGEDNYTSLGVREDTYITLPNGRSGDVKVTYTLATRDLEAPLTVGQQVGTINFILDNNTIDQRPLIVLKAVPEAGFFGKLVDFIKQTFYHWFN